MRPVGIELGDELVQDDTQMLLVQDDEVMPRRCEIGRNLGLTEPFEAEAAAD